MDEAGQEQSSDAAVDLTVPEPNISEKDSNQSVPVPVLPPTSVDSVPTEPLNLTTPASIKMPSPARESNVPSEKSCEEGTDKGSSQTSTLQPPVPSDNQTKPVSSQNGLDDMKPDDKSLSGASCGASEQCADGAMGPGGIDVMAKMREVMAKRSAPATPKPPTGDKNMQGMMAMMSKGGMPDMMAMMGKSGGGGMPDMMSMMAKGGMPNMMAMMAKGGGGMPGMDGMAKLMDSIVEASFATPDSDSSDDENSVPIEIPCQYCTRLFTNQMSLKTHILVAHEDEDTSVLNLTKLVIDKGKRGVKDHHSSRRKHSKDLDMSAAVQAVGDDSQQLVSDSVTTQMTTQDLAAAECSRGIKRGLSENEADTSGRSGASGEQEGSLQRQQAPEGLGSGAVPSSCVSGSPSESRKRSARQRSLGSTSGDSSSQVTSKKSKSDDEKLDSDANQSKPLLAAPSAPDVDKSDSVDEQCSADSAPRSTPTHSSKHKHAKTESKDPETVQPIAATRSKRLSRKDKAVTGSDTETGVSQSPHGRHGKTGGGRQSGSVPVASDPTSSLAAQGTASPSPSRRSLRSRKSH